MKNRTESPQSPAEMADHLRALLAEAEKTLAENATEQTRSKIEDLQDRIEDAQEKIKEVYGDARKKVLAGARRADETIRTHPYESLAIALGVGVLLGALIRRNN